MIASPDVMSDDLPLIRWEGRTKGSPYTVQIAATNVAPAALDALKQQIETRLKEINRQMSHFDPGSELSRFNRAPAGQPFTVSPEFARVMRFALTLAERSGGAFDPTLGPVINLWGFGEQSDQRAVPSEREITDALRRVGHRHLTVTDCGELVKDTPQLTLNLSAVAKGFGVDEIIRILRQQGFTNSYAAIAGEVMASGHNARGTPWQVAITEPLPHWREGDPFTAIVPLSNRAISTSGDYQKFFVNSSGRRLSHIFDPRSGQPVQHDLTAVSVVAPDCMTADALATTLFVLGAKAGLSFIEDRPEAAALFIVRNPDGTFSQSPSRRFMQLSGLRP